MRGMRKISSIESNTEGVLTISFNNGTTINLDYITADTLISIGDSDGSDSYININIGKDNGVFIDYPHIGYNKE